MPDVVTFDGPAKIITEIDIGTGDNTLSVTEIYSEWKVWTQQSDNIKYLPAFSVLGGDPISPTESLGTTYFLENGWLFRPSERNHKLTLVGNIFSRTPGASVFTPTLGSFTVEAETKVSALTSAIKGALSTSEQALVDAIATRVAELHLIHGLDATSPMTVTPTSRGAGTITQTITGDGSTSSTVTRQP